MKLLHHRISPETLGVVRVWVFGLWLVKVLICPLRGLPDQAAADFAATGLLGMAGESVWDQLLAPGCLWTLEVLLVGAIGLAVLGVGTRAAMIASVVLLLLRQGIVAGFGLSSFAEIPLLLAAIILACFPAGDAVALRPTRDANRKPVTYSAAVVSLLLMFCLTYSFSAAQRLITGPGLFAQAALATY